MLLLLIGTIVAENVSAESFGKAVLGGTIGLLLWAALVIVSLISLYLLIRLAMIVVPFLFSNPVGWVILGIAGLTLITLVILLLALSA